MQPPSILFPDIETWAVGYLEDALGDRGEAYTDNVYVATKVADPRADRMVIVRRDGGTRLDVFRETARLGVQVWGESDEVAADLAAMTRALLWAAPDGNPVLRVDDIGGPVAIADPSNQPLRFFTVQVLTRGSALSA